MIEIDVHNELRERFNPDGSLLRCYQLRLLSLLKFIDNFCKENDIKYWLCGGSCLGAIRHNGFIPWDDDVDIEMDRENYEKFLTLFHETDDYVLQTKDNDTHYVCAFGKLRDKNSIVSENIHTDKYKYKGAFVDIFVLDRRPKVFAKTVARGVEILDSLDHKPANKKLFNILFRFYKCLLYFFIDFLTKYVHSSNNKILRYSYGTYFYDSEVFTSDVNSIEYIPFEGILLPVPGNYDHYLRSFYGDYMQLPSLESISHDIHLKKIELDAEFKHV